MKRRNKFSLEPKYLLIICSVLCMVMIVVSFRFSEALEPAKTAIGTVISPMQNGINQVGTYISNKFQVFQDVKRLLKENEMLKEKNAALSNENKLLQRDQQDFSSLKKLFELNEKYEAYPKVAARVISDDGNNWYNTFLIDKGRKDGIEVDMNVIAGDGLVGIVTEVGYNYSRVRSIIDDNSNVRGMFLKTSEGCNVKGSLKSIDKGVLDLELINKSSDVKENYEVVTSNISDKYLQGILIGYVNKIELDSNNMTKSGYLTPVVDFKKLDMVLVITELKEPLKD